MVRLPTPRLALEFRRLRQENFPLALLVDGLARFVRDTFRRDVTVTSIFRSPEIQQAVYGGGTKKIGGPSPHLTWHAVDLATLSFAPEEVAAVLEFGRRYDRYNRLRVIPAARSRTIWLHRTGTLNPHFHLQYKGPPVYAV